MEARRGRGRVSGSFLGSVKLANLPHWLPSSSDHTTVLVMNVLVMSVLVRCENPSRSNEDQTRPPQPAMSKIKGTRTLKFTCYWSYVMVTSSPALQESTRSFSSTTHIERGMWRLSRNSCVALEVIPSTHTLTPSHPHTFHYSSHHLQTFISFEDICPMSSFCTCS